MLIDTWIYHIDDQTWHPSSQQITNRQETSVIFLFGDSHQFQSEASFHALHQLYPHAKIIGASSSGHILGAEISTAPLVATAVQLEHGSVCMAYADLAPDESIQQLAENLLKQLPAEGLRHLFILADGLSINGSELTHCINHLSGNCTVSGGMAGDGDRFQATWVMANASAQQHRVAALAFYGEQLLISTGIHGGWSPFGADRWITKSRELLAKVFKPAELSLN